MSKELKASVLAKCETCKTSQGGWMPVGEDSGGLAVEYFSDSEYFQIGSQHHVVCLKFNDETHSESVVWPLAAQMLGIANEYQFGYSRAFKEGHDAAMAKYQKPEHRPSDELLWEAYLAAATRFVGVTGCNIVNIKEIAKECFDKWLTTIKNSSNALEQGINE